MRIALLGATGYGGIEALRLIQGREDLELLVVFSDRYAGESIAQVLPQFRGTAIGRVTFSSLAQFDDSVWVDVALLAMPHGEAPKYVERLLERGVRVIDFSGDYRLPNETYELWYKATPAKCYAPAVYGLPEMYREQIRKATLVANPGCYATASELALLPLVEQRMIDVTRIVIDAKSGVSGAGRNPKVSSLFGEVDGNTLAYKVGQHQHTPEIERILSDAWGQTTEYGGKSNGNHSVRVLLTTQLLPIKRGIYITAYGQLEKTMTTVDIIGIYRRRYEKEPFVTVLDPGDMPEIRQVTGTNLCQIGIYVDERTDTVLAVAAIDNLLKGAAGQALQNMNLMFGLKETTGLVHSSWW